MSRRESGGDLLAPVSASVANQRTAATEPDGQLFRSFGSAARHGRNGRSRHANPIGLQPSALRTPKGELAGGLPFHPAKLATSATHRTAGISPALARARAHFACSSNKRGPCSSYGRARRSDGGEFKHLPRLLSGALVFLAHVDSHEPELAGAVDYGPRGKRAGQCYRKLAAD